MSTIESSQSEESSRKSITSTEVGYLSGIESGMRKGLLDGYKDMGWVYPMTREEVRNELLELEKCKKSPYYFFTKYWMVNGEPFTTPLTEEEFNKKVTQDLQKRI